MSINTLHHPCMSSTSAGTFGCYQTLLTFTTIRYHPWYLNLTQSQKRNADEIWLEVLKLHLKPNVIFFLISQNY